MTLELQTTAGPLLTKLQERLGNGYVVLTAEIIAFAHGAPPMLEWKAYHFASGFSTAQSTPEAAVEELLARNSASDLLAQAEHLRDRAEELERTANQLQEA